MDFNGDMNFSHLGMKQKGRENKKKICVTSLRISGYFVLLNFLRKTATATYFRIHR